MSKKEKERGILKMRKEEKGITLVALIITIVVMLILVAVSLNILVNSNLIGHAEKTGDAYTGAIKNEEKLGNDGITVNGKRYANVEDVAKGKVLIESNIPGGTKVDENKEYAIKGETRTAVIPGGFTVSGIDSERTIEEGLVIYLIPDDELENVKWDGTEKTKYDQFVWIPISHEQINNMFICQAKTGSNGNCNITVENGVAKCTVHNSPQMAGRLYATSTGENYNKKAYTEVYTANTGLREPDVVTGNSTGDGRYYDGRSAPLEFMSTVTGDNTSYKNTAKFKETLQNDYNEIVALIYNAKGYYVGRYETSNITTTKGTAINVVAGTNSGISNISWYNMYAQQKVYAANKGLGNKVKSSMMLGTCHDQMLEFVNVAGKYDVTKAGNVGHTSSKFITKPYLTGGVGYNENYSGYETEPYKDLSKNIYDLEGNVYEFTTEASNTNRRSSLQGPAFTTAVVLLVIAAPTVRTTTAQRDGSRATLFVML